MPPNTPQNPQDRTQQPGTFKGQPWVLFDTIAAHSFLMGDPSNDGKAIGGDGPAVSSSGEIVFFQSAGRTKATMPWFTNLDMPGQLAYGMQVWQIYVRICFPAMAGVQSLDPNPATDSPFGVPPSVRLAEAILGYASLQLNLGQEEQTEWQLSRFGAGGGMALQGGGGVGLFLPSNSQVQSQNVMKLPEPVEMMRTQNLNVKIRLAPQVFALIGTATAPGVGAPLAPYVLETVSGEDPETVSLRLPPFAIEVGLVGKRTKRTQYGQVVRGDEP